MSALLFLYREVLGTDLRWLDDLIRARRPARLPTVLTVAEVQAVLARVTMLPRQLVAPLEAHLERMRQQHAIDCKGVGWVEPPRSLAGKAPGAGRQWRGPWAFPATGVHHARRRHPRARPRLHAGRTGSRLAGLAGHGPPRLLHRRYWRKTKQVTLEPGASYERSETITDGASTHHEESRFTETCTVQPDPDHHGHRVRRRVGDLPVGDALRLARRSGRRPRDGIPGRLRSRAR